MAKRASPDEQPYRPLLDTSLVSAALTSRNPINIVSPSNQPAKIVEISRQEPARKSEERPPIPLLVDRPTQEPSVRSLGYSVEKLDQEKRILFTESESRAVDRLVHALASQLHAQIKVSHVIRALVSLLLNAEGDIDARAGEAGSLVRPPNGDIQALQQFERNIANILGAALRDAGPIR